MDSFNVLAHYTHSWIHHFSQKLFQYMTDCATEAEIVETTFGCLKYVNSWSFLIYPSLMTSPPHQNDENQRHDDWFDDIIFLISLLILVLLGLQICRCSTASIQFNNTRPFEKKSWIEFKNYFLVKAGFDPKPSWSLVFCWDHSTNGDPHVSFFLSCFLSVYLWFNIYLFLYFQLIISRVGIAHHLWLAQQFPHWGDIDFNIYSLSQFVNNFWVKNVSHTI